MSGPIMGEEVYNIHAESIEFRDIDRIRSLADAVVEKDYMFGKTLTDVQRRAIASLLRAKADKLEAHMRVIDELMSDEFSDLLHDIEWCDSGDYGDVSVKNTWEDYDSVDNNKEE